MGLSDLDGWKQLQQDSFVKILVYCFNVPTGKKKYSEPLLLRKIDR